MFEKVAEGEEKGDARQEILAREQQEVKEMVVV